MLSQTNGGPEKISEMLTGASISTYCREASVLEIAEQLFKHYADVRNPKSVFKKAEHA